jgi:hypothetical protein
VVSRVLIRRRIEGPVTYAADVVQESDVLASRGEAKAEAINAEEVRTDEKSILNR